MRLGGWVVVVVGAVVGIFTVLVAYDPRSTSPVTEWACAVGAWTASIGTYWLLARTAAPERGRLLGPRPPDVVREIDAMSSRVIRQPVGLVTFGVWIVVLVVVVTAWVASLLVFGLIAGLITTWLEGIGIVIPDVLAAVGLFTGLVLSIAAAIVAFQQTRRIAWIRYFLP